MPTIPKILISEEDYLEEERKALNKSEFYKGEIFAMAVGSKRHNKIPPSIVFALTEQLKRKGCSIFSSDQRVHNNENSLYTYPDLTIVCGEEKYLDEESDTLLNPTVIIEVLSPSTEDYDRGTKFKLYRSIPSLKNYILVSSTEYTAEIYTRIENDEWVLHTTKEKDGFIHISAIDYDLFLKDIMLRWKI